MLIVNVASSRIDFLTVCPSFLLTSTSLEFFDMEREGREQQEFKTVDTHDEVVYRCVL